MFRYGENIMTTYNVSDTTALNAALKAAHGGDTIKLSAGNYSGVVISNINYTSPVTITSSPSQEAVLAGLKVVNSSNIQFTHLEFDTNGQSGPVDPYYAFRVTGSSNIQFSNLNIHGDESSAPGTQISGFDISSSTNVSVSNSTLSYMNIGIVANNDKGLSFSGNTFSYLDKGGIEMGGSSSVSVSNNTFTDFEVSAGVHADAVQVYTAGTTQSASDLSITGNDIDRGNGDAIQGIFIQDETGDLPFHNLTITNNQVIGGMWNSIYVHGTVTGSLDVSNNLVESWSGLDPGSATSSTSGIFPTANFRGGIDLIGNLSGATVLETGNTAQAFLTGSQTNASAPTGNTLVGAIAPVAGSTGGQQTPISATPEKFNVSEHNAVVGNGLTGDGGAGLYLADVGIGTGVMKTTSAAGSAFVGTYGTLTVSQDGSLSYNETKDGLVVGQTYVDHFTTTIASAQGGVVTSSIDISVTGSATGNGLVDNIVGGAGAEKFTGFGSGSHLTSGTGPDTFQFASISSSMAGKSTTIIGFKQGDIIDLSGIDPNLHLVARFDGQPNELMITHVSTGIWEIIGEPTGSKGPAFDIHLTGVEPMLTLTGSMIHL